MTSSNQLFPIPFIDSTKNVNPVKFQTQLTQNTTYVQTAAETKVQAEGKQIEKNTKHQTH